MSANSQKQSGFIAIISVIIITAILILVAVTLSTTGFYSRSNVLDSEYKERGTSIAESCASIAFLKLASNPAYATNGTTSVGASSCYMEFVPPLTGSTRAFKVKTIYRNTYTTFLINYNVTTHQVLSWEEIPTF